MKPLGMDINKMAWIAARYEGDRLPKEFRLGDGLKAGTAEYTNRPLKKGYTYRVFLRAYSASSVSIVTGCLSMGGIYCYQCEYSYWVFVELGHILLAVLV